jgi:predicted outer membrane repeat protein
MKKIILLSVALSFTFLLQSQIIYVSTGGSGLKDGSSWTNTLDGNSPYGNGFTKLAQAIQTATSGNQFWIAEGNYKAATDGDRNKSFILKDGVSCYGGFKGNENSTAQRGKGITTFSGDIGSQGVNTDNSYHVFNINSQVVQYKNTSILDQVVISSGYANGITLASQGGGVIVGSGTKLKISNSTILGNTSMGNGGGMFINSDAKVDIINSSIIENNQIVTSGWSAAGCGIFSQGNLNLRNCQILKNSNSTEGSGIYNADSLMIIDCKIDSNLSVSRYGNAGGISNSGYCSIKRSTVSYNAFKIKAGGIWNKVKSTMVIDSSEVSYNIVENSSNGIGGGILNDGILTITNSSITHNSSILNGGGIYNSVNSQCYLFKSLIACNNADGGLSEIGGGGVFNQGKLELNGCIISNNSTAWGGGGIYNPTVVRNCIVVNNVKSNIWRTGGGIWIGPDCQGIFNSTIMNNSGEGISSSIYEHDNLVIHPDTFLLKNSIVFGNDVQLSGNFDVTNSCIEGIYPDHNNIFSNPVCVNPTKAKGIQYDGLNADWRLQAYSPCINKGDNTFVGTNETLDADGNPRIKFNVVDMGAFEYQTTPTDEVDYSNNIVFVSDEAVLSGTGTSWSKSLAGNAPSHRYPGYSMLYQAIKDAPQKCQVWIKKGTFPVAVDTDRNKSFLIESKTKIYGGFAGNETTLKQRIPNKNETILSGNIGNVADSLDNSYHVIYSIASATSWKDSALIDNITIRDGVANGTGENIGGGGIFLNTNCNLKLKSCKIVSNSGIGKRNPSGGALMNKGILRMENSEVTNNRAVYMGGGIFNESYLSLKNCLINNNKLTFPAGASFVETWGGGGIYNYLNAKLTIDSCEITNNTTQNNLHGGGIHNRGETLIDHSLIDNNFSARDGGGIYSTGAMKISNSHFSKNQSAFYGGAISSTDSLVIDFSYLGYNVGVSVPTISSSGYLVVTNSELCHGIQTGQGGSAGAIRSSGKTKIINCDIHSHDTKGYEYIQTGGMFDLLICLTGSDGGGILHTADSLFIDNCKIHNNIASGGGAVAIRGGFASIKNTFLTNNLAADGAAIMNNGKTSVVNCLIVNNSGHRGGIILNVDNGIYQITNSTIANNFLLSLDNENAILKHGMFNKYSSNNINVSNSIIKSESKIVGYYPGSTGSENISYSCITGGFAGVGNINADPMFVNPTSGNDTTFNALTADWTLLDNSPCINTGNDELCSVPFDLGGNQRKFGNIDMGAYEFKSGNTSFAIQHEKTEENIFIYPNPVNDELSIELKGNTKISDFEVINSFGQVVTSGILFEKISISTASFAPGIYLVKFKSGNTFDVKKIIKN